MDKDGEYACLAGDADGPQHGISQEGLANPLIVVPTIDGKAPEPCEIVMPFTLQVRDSTHSI